MSSKAKRQNDPNVYAVMHRTGRVWRGLIMRNGTGRDSQSPPAIVEFRDFPLSMTARIDSWLDGHNVAEVLCVLPAAAVICRTCSLPDASIEHLEPALRLQAEAHLFGIAPTHRLGMAVLEQSPGETTRSGIILAWPESSQVELPPTTRPVSFTSDVAALAAIVDGHRPPQPLLWLDRGSGSVALALSHASGVSFRGLREDEEDSEAWRTSIGRVIAETGLNAGHTSDFIEGIVHATHDALMDLGQGESTLLLPPDVIERSAERLTDAPADAQWWTQYGIAAGAVMVRTGPLAPLSQMREAAPAQAPSRIKDAIEAMSSPRVAARLAVLTLVVLMFGPLVMNWARLKVLEMRHADIGSKLRLVNEVRDSLIVYRELGNSAWPMTKILSDIASNTPEGVELEFIRVNPGGSFTARGRALPHDGRTATEVVVLMQQNLRQSGIFTEITLNWGDSDAYGNYEFEMAARFLNPYRQHRYPDELDYGRLTLAERLYGPTATQTQTTTREPERETEQRAQSTESPAPSNDQTQTRQSQPTRVAAADETSRPAPANEDPYADLHNTRVDSGFVDRPSPRSTAGALRGDATTREEARGQSSIPQSQDIPEPMTEAQIQAMSEAEVLDMLMRVSHARRAARARNDEELESRLQREFNWLMARRRGDS